MSVRKDLGIYMADRVADDGDITTLHKKDLNSLIHTLNFKNVMSELIPPNQWHFCTTDEKRTPGWDMDETRPRYAREQKLKK